MKIGWIQKVNSMHILRGGHTQLILLKYYTEKLLVVLLLYVHNDLWLWGTIQHISLKTQLHSLHCDGRKISDAWQKIFIAKVGI